MFLCAFDVSRFAHPTYGIFNAPFIHIRQKKAENCNFQQKFQYICIQCHIKLSSHKRMFFLFVCFCIPFFKNEYRRLQKVEESMQRVRNCLWFYWVRKRTCVCPFKCHTLRPTKDSYFVSNSIMFSHINIDSPIQLDNLSLQQFSHCWFYFRLCAISVSVVFNCADTQSLIVRNLIIFSHQILSIDP